jgi:dolichol kinase
LPQGFAQGDALRHPRLFTRSQLEFVFPWEHIEAVTTFSESSRDLALSIHRFFAELDRSRFKWQKLIRTMPAQLTVIRRSLKELLERSPAISAPDVVDDSDSLSLRLAELDRAIATHAPKSSVRSEWIAFRTRVVPSYEALASTLRASSLHVPSLRPKNYARTAFHVLAAVLSIVVLELSPSWNIVIAIAWGGAIAGWTMELSRRFSKNANRAMMWFFGPVAHPHEAREINSASWYALSLALLASTREIVPCVLALVVLGVGDPAAAFIGRRWGRLRWVNERSVEGTLTLVVASVAVGVPLIVLAHGIALGPAFAISSAAAVLGAFAELYSRKIDDNLSVPVMAWLGAFVMAYAIS